MCHAQEMIPVGEAAATAEIVKRLRERLGSLYSEIDSVLTSIACEMDRDWSSEVQVRNQ